MAEDADDHGMMWLVICGCASASPPVKSPESIRELLSGDGIKIEKNGNYLLSGPVGPVGPVGPKGAGRFACHPRAFPLVVIGRVPH